MRCDRFEDYIYIYIQNIHIPRNIARAREREKSMTWGWMGGSAESGEMEEESGRGDELVNQVS